MKRAPRALLRSIALVLLAGLASPAAAGDDAATQRIRALDAEEAAAMLAADLPALERIWSPAFAVNSPENTVRTKSQVLALVREGRIRYARFERSVERVDLHGDFAVSMGGEVLVAVGERPDAGETRTRRYTHVWQWSGARWSLVARHANWVSPPPQ